MESNPGEGVDISDAVDMAQEGLPEYVLTTAGCYSDEDNDCGIVALALATDLPYSLIHDLARVCLGRENKTPALNMHLAASLYPFRFRLVSKKRCRLHNIPKKYPEGRYYVQIGGRDAMGNVSCHALALIGGKIHDRHIESPDRWVHGVWKVVGIKSLGWWGWKRYGIKPEEGSGNSRV